MNLFEITSKGVALGKTNEGTTSDRHLEFAYPANFHTRTTLPDNINYTPEWWAASPFFINGITSTSIPMGFKKVGTHVYLQGSMNGARYDGDIANFMILPEELRPVSDHYFVCPSTTNGRVAAFRITTTGYVQLLYTIVPQEEGYDAATNKGSWRYDICTDYWVANNEPLTSTVMQIPEFTYLFNVGQVQGIRLRGNAGVPNLTTTQMQCYDNYTSGRFGVYSNAASAYGYICVDGTICVPAGKTQLKVNLCHYNNVTTSYTLAAALALIDAEETTITRASNARLTFSGNYINSVCGSNIQFNNSNAYGNNTNYVTYTLDLPATFNHSRPVYVVVSMRTSTNYRRDLMTNKIWFE